MLVSCHLSLRCDFNYGCTKKGGEAFTLILTFGPSQLPLTQE